MIELKANFVAAEAAIDSLIPEFQNYLSMSIRYGSRMPIEEKEQQGLTEPASSNAHMG